MRLTHSLPDVNLFFALLHPRHADHGRAQAWLERQIGVGSIRICRVVQMGALRLLTSPAVMREDILKPAQAWAGYEGAMLDERLVAVEEPTELGSAWRILTDGVKGLTKVDTDTYLAAFALAGGFTLATFDKGFARFDGLRTEFPL